MNYIIILYNIIFSDKQSLTKIDRTTEDQQMYNFHYCNLYLQVQQIPLHAIDCVYIANAMIPCTIKPHPPDQTAYQMIILNVPETA